MEKTKPQIGDTIMGDEWGWPERLEESEGWSDSITAMSILCRKTLHALPAPNSGLQAYGFGAGLIIGKPHKRILGETVWYCVAGLKIEMQVYNTNQKVTKVTVTRLPEQLEE